MGATSVLRENRNPVVRCGHCGRADAKPVSSEWQKQYGLPEAICGPCFARWYDARLAQGEAPGRK